jgi:integration host factor subunit beta
MSKNRLELIKLIAEKTELPVIRAEVLVKLVFNLMADALRRGETIELRGFGTFKIRRYRGYGGRNPRNGNPVLVRAKRRPYFRAGRELRARVNARLESPRQEPGASSRR